MINTNARVDNRRNWKGEVVDYDAIQAYENHECTYCLTDAQVAVLAGIIEPLGWATRWQSDTQPIDPSWVQEFRDDIQRRLSVSCCGDEVLFRYTEAGVLESSEDGGLTWQPAPQDDIRITAPQFPPVPGEPSPDKSCIAATGMSQLIKEQVGDQLTDDMSRYTLAELISDWTSTYIGTSNIFTAILTVAANQIFALIIAVLRPALTEEVYDSLTCAFYCNISEDLTFDEAAVDQVRADIGESIEGVATLFLQQLVYLLGSSGLTNLARAQAATEGDCDCDCSGCTGSWVALQGTIISNDGFTVRVEAAPIGGGFYQAYITSNDIDICCPIQMTSVVSGTITEPSPQGQLCGSGDLVVINPTGQFVNTFLRRSTMPFTVDFIFG
jgi:hypothetical protein